MPLSLKSTKASRISDLVAKPPVAEDASINIPLILLSSLALLIALTISRKPRTSSDCNSKLPLNSSVGTLFVLSGIGLLNFNSNTEFGLTDTLSEPKVDAMLPAILAPTKNKASIAKKTPRQEAKTNLIN